MRFRATARIQGQKKFFYSRISQEDANRKRDLAKNPNPLILELTDPNTFAHFVYSVFCPRKYESIQPTYKTRIDSMLRLHVLPALGPLAIKSIGYKEIQAMKDGLERTRKGNRLERPLSAKSKREALILTREILALYGSLEGAKGNHTRDDWKLVKLPKVDRKKEREEPEGDFVVRILNAAQGHWMEGPLLMALFLGLRRGEVCGLKWSAIDRKAMRLHVREQRHPLLAEGSLPKMGKARKLPLPEEILARIDTLGDRSSIYVFTEDGQPIDPNHITRDIRHLCDQAKVQRRTFHDLRSFAASNMAAIGADVWSIVEILGHTKIDTTALYVNQRENVKRDTLRQLVRGHFG